MHPGEPAGLPARSRDRSQQPARQVRPRPRPTPAWPPGRDGGRGRRAPRSRGRRRWPAAPTACGLGAAGVPPQLTTPAPHSAAVVHLVARSARLRRRRRRQGPLSDVAHHIEPRVTTTQNARHGGSGWPRHRSGDQRGGRHHRGEYATAGSAANGRHADSMRHAQPLPVLMLADMWPRGADPDGSSIAVGAIDDWNFGDEWLDC
jgi:hypothetical protein